MENKELNTYEETSKDNQRKSKKQVKSTTLYPIYDLIQNSEKLTGYKSFVAVGALNKCEKTEMTKDEFKELVKNFVKKGVE